jgi:hypothetical protein
MATPTTLPASFNAGAILEAAQLNALRGAFRVLQVVAVDYGTPAANSTSTYADTGLTLSITPQSATSKILALAIQNGCGKEAGSASSSLDVQLMRGATVLGFASGGETGSSVVNYFGSIMLAYLDSPATTSAVTYKTQFRNYANTASVRVQTGATVNPKSMMVLMEISA